MITDNQRRPVMDLQLFSDEAPEEGTTSPDVTGQDVTDPITPEDQETLLSFLEKQMQGEPATPAPEEPAAGQMEQGSAPEESLILGKFRTPKDLENAYLEGERRITQYGQQFADLQKQWQQFLAAQQQQQYQQQPQFSPEEIQKKNEEWLNRFYEKPVDTLSELVRSTVQQSVEQQIAPVAQKIQFRESYENFNQQMATARTRYADFDALLPEMNKIVQEHGHYYANVPNAVEAIYGLAKARTGEQAVSRPIEELVKDPQVRNAVLKSYVQEIKQGKPPSVIGSQPGEAPASPPVDFSQPGSAKKATLSYLSKWLGGGSK